MLPIAFFALLTCILIKQFTNDIHGYNLSFVHALFQSITSLALLPTLTLDECYLIEDMLIPEFEICLLVLIIYLAFDLCANECKIDVQIHHITVLFVAGLSLYFGSLHTIGVLLLLNEISTVFLNMSYWFKTEPQKKRKSHCEVLIRILFVVSFFLFRVLLIPFVLVLMFSCAYTVLEYIMLLAIGSHAVLNFYWFSKIIKKICL